MHKGMPNSEKEEDIKKKFENKEERKIKIFKKFVEEHEKDYEKELKDIEKYLGMQEMLEIKEKTEAPKVI